MVARERNSSAMLRRQKDQRRGIKFTMMICGSSGTGKTTFVNALMDQQVVPHKFQGYSGDIPKTLTFANVSGAIVDAASVERHFDPTLAHEEPGIAITETTVDIVDEDDSKLMLSIIDTPGFGENIDNEICYSEIVHYLRQQFDSVLAEETRVKRNPRFEDTRVHVCLYFITPTGHGLRELDVVTMKKLSKYVNVIPIIGRADSFKPSELIQFKRSIIEDIERFNIPIFQFSYDEEEDDVETVDENKFLSSLQPFAVVSSEKTFEVDGVTVRGRQYPWGIVNAEDPKISDFSIVRSVVLGSHLQDLKDITHDLLYEAYRTEKLMMVTGETETGVGMSEPPSLSNLAAIANSRSMATINTNTAVASPIPDVTDSESHDTTQKNGNVKSMLIGSNEAVPSSPVPEHVRLRRPSESTESAVVPGTPSSTIRGDSIYPGSPTIPGSPSVSVRSGTSDVRHSQLRKISETVPYVLKHDNLVSKQAKLEELERRSAQELARRAAELERKAAELKMREKLLKQLARERGLDEADVASKVESVGYASDADSKAESYAKKETNNSE
ncbi:unnamed protein product [Kuraishia capsulata CBS 1993]|uniref:Septin-type G domain-containing protein n=1 Tax=Kuraishia capsulata CBS 1993 TaxID=1382522 RepID=W6MGG3_9ASCO|nr:uncharacterized protein KUCA_T00000559001 [Kuraishia capsulata CBS 1993]CDK24593.1 unnamed protein product [Kuraishia capsulata CBS 1993]